MKSKLDFSSDEEYKEYLRSYFAGLVMQGLISSPDSEKYNIGDGNKTDNAVGKSKFCVLMADELLKQLEL